MAVFTLETDNPCGQIIRLVHFPSWCEFETDNCWVFPSRIHIRRIDCTVFFSQARLQFRRGYNSTIFNMASMAYAMFSFPELNALFLVPGFSCQNQTSLSVLMWIQDGSSQVAQARYMSSSMWTFALLRDSSDLHIYKDLYGERSKPEIKRKITVELQ